MNILYSFVLIARFAKAGVLVSSLCVLCALCGQSSAQDFKTIHDGVEYAQVEHKLGSDPVKINLLRLDLTKVRLDVHHAMDAAIGLEKTSSIATRHGAVAAINAGFFRLDSSLWAGDNVGLLVIDHKVISDASNDRIVLGLNNLSNITEVAFGRSKLSQSIRVGNSSREILISGTNRELGRNETILYTPFFHRTTLTQKSDIEVEVRNGRVTQIIRGQQSSAIPADGYVLSANGEEASLLASSLKVGARLNPLRTVVLRRVSHEPDPPEIENFEDAVAGVPQLIKEGKIDITWEQEKASRSFAETRHPRTAVAKLKDGKFLMITVDGRQPGVSVGMSLQELAEYLLSLGAVDAMNLDGGGSTTMVLDGKVVNTPSDKEGERKVGDAILVTLRKKPLAKNKK